MPLTKLDRFRIRVFGVCANAVESCYFPLLYHRYGGIYADRKIRYSPGKKRAVMDAYFPGRACGAPLLFYIHGGGWVSGLRRIRKYYCMRWVKEGFVAANVDYDYGPDNKFPDHLQQVFTALDCMLDKAGSYGFDPGKVVIAGESAGAYLAAMMCAVITHPELFDSLNINFAHRNAFAPAAAVLLSGIYDPQRSLATRAPFIDLYISALVGENKRRLNERFDGKFRGLCVPEAYADEKFIPSFVVGSDRDKLEPESAAFAEKLSSGGAECEYFVCTGINGMHAAALDCRHGKSGKACFAEALKFTERFIGR